MGATFGKVASHRLSCDMIAMIRGTVQAALGYGSTLAVKRHLAATLAIAALCLTGCASKVDYAPKTSAQLDQDAMDNRVFYQGWLHPGAPRESRESLNNTLQ